MADNPAEPFGFDAGYHPSSYAPRYDPREESSFQRAFKWGCGLYLGWTAASLALGAITLFAFFLCCGGMAGIGAFFESTNPGWITRQKYDRVEMGMSYDQVVKIMGSPGEQLSSVELAGAPYTEMRSWKNSDGSNAAIMFQNDQVVSKAQLGLR